MQKTDNNFNIKEEEFSVMIASLKAGDNTLFKNIFLAHAEACINFLKIKYKATHDDAYDTMIETMINFRQRLVDNKIEYGNIRSLFLLMASQYYLKFKNKNKHSDLNENFDLIEEDEEDYSEEQLKRLKRSFDQLKDNCQKIFRLHYYNELKLNEVAEILNENYDSIRKQKERCKESLLKIYKGI